jgi:DNA polymerase-3 subunit beta
VFLKVSFDRSLLLAELQMVARATATRSAIQSLAGVLFSASGDSVELAATDTEIGLRSRLGAKVEREGTVLLPGRLLAEILRVLDGEAVELASEGERGEVTVLCGQSRFVIRSLPPEDFPRLPELQEEGAVKLAAAAFAETVERVARAASRDETRPVLTGILVSVSGTMLRMVATDSYRLSVKETTLASPVDQEFEVNVPARALQELTRVVADRDAQQLTASARDNQIVFGIDDVTLSSRMIDGQFPNYRQLLPESYEHEIELDRNEVASTVRRVSLMAQRNAPLRLAFDPGTLTVTAQTPDVGEASESVPVNFQGERLEIGFNPQFLQDGLEGVRAERLRLKLISPLRPGLIEAADTAAAAKPAGAAEAPEEGAAAETTDAAAADRFLYLIMPVRLNV